MKAWKFRLLCRRLANEFPTMKKLLVLCALLCVAGGEAIAAGPATAKPHIIFVLTDDMGAGDVGCYGGSVAPTPNIDRLAREGTRFTRYYSASPICSPSRAGLLTGQFPARWRITSFLQTRAGNRACEQVDFLDPSAPSLARALKTAGYATAHIGKWHLGGGRDVTNAPKFTAYGFDEGVGTYESPEPHPDITATHWIWSARDKVKRWNRTAFFVERTLDFMAHHKDKPCFVNLWLDDPHTPWVPEPKDGETPAPGNTRGKLVRVLRENDRQIGRLMDALPANTLLIYTSDNGALPTFNGARTLGWRGSKLSLYEGGIRLPFIARWPGKIPAGRVDDTTVLSALDMMPTLCALAGAKSGAAPDGEDFSAALLGQAAQRTRPLFWEYGRNTNSFAFPAAMHRSPNLAVREGHWKLLVNADGSGTELYDIIADANETKNLAAAEPDVSKRLRQAALAWRKSLP
jgi:arylsulfatase A-like enzyme